jgi:glycerol-3-phosphate acyltransferase PlsX
MVTEAPPVAVDAMGGDYAPRAVVEGAIAAARKGTGVILVGREEVIRAELARHRVTGLPVGVRNASQSIEMGDHPSTAMRRRKDNSIRLCFELVKSGDAGGMVSAGNSGAVMAGALFVLGRLEAVERPAIISVIPALKGKPLLLDMGANVSCKAKHLVQFALLGEVYSRRVLGIAKPRVAILSNGEEPTKGTELTRQAAAALRASALDFRGYCEGRDICRGEHDVIVTDGFTGNVALKTMEGTAQAVAGFLKEALSGSYGSMVGAMLARGAFTALKKRIDWRTIGGAPLVGVNGIGVISHGSSDALAIENAIRLVREEGKARALEEMAAAAALADGLLAKAAVVVGEAEAR